MGKYTARLKMIKGLVLGDKKLLQYLGKQQEYLDWYEKHGNRIASFKDKHRGQDCIIIGNGPSLNHTNLEVLKDYHTFGMNKIYLIENRGIDLNLSYYVSVNEHVIEQSKAQIEGLSCPAFLSEPFARKHLAPQEHIYTLFTKGSWTFEKELTLPVYAGGTVTYMAMQIAYYLGFERVFLIGVDHTFAQKGKANETQIMKEDDANHFDPNYFKGQKWQLADLDASEISYSMAKLTFERDNRQILDATVGGKLDIFPKVGFDEAISQMRKK